MNVLVVNNSQTESNALRDIIIDICQTVDVFCFGGADREVDSAIKTECDVCFVELAADRAGLDFARKLQKHRSGVNIIFISDCEELAYDAFSLNASGYILRPISEVDVRNALEHLRYPVSESNELNIRCFGNFEVFERGEPIHFGRSKAKEVLAYLIDLRGASANTNEICSALFEDDSPATKHYFRNLISELKKTLVRHGAKDMLVCSRNSFAVDTSRIKCDYYDYLNDCSYVNYSGEYMKQYSWAETTNGFLSAQLSESEDGE